MFCNNCGEKNPDGAKFCHVCGLKLQDARKQTREKEVHEEAKTECKEITLYSDEKGVRITNSRAIFRNKTYVMTNISSISIGKKDPNWIPAGGVISLGVICLIFNFYFGLFIVCVGIIAFIFTKGDYTVIITSASGETDAFSDKDEIYIQNIITALNEAIIKQG